MPSLKQRFEEHAVIFCAGLVIAGFFAGFAARAYVLPAASAPISCTIKDLPSLEQGHTQRIAALQASLVELENRASDRDLLSYYQEKYQAAADRIRRDIAAENSVYQATIKALSAKCADA
jgi:hypothetical protein